MTMIRRLLCVAAAAGLATMAAGTFAQQPPGSGGANTPPDADAPKAAAKGQKAKGGGSAPQPIRGEFPGPSKGAANKIDPGASAKR